MIIVALTGGLGNQMFQYAAAKALAAKHNELIVLDFGGIQIDPNPTKFDIEVDKFDLGRRHIKIKNIWISRIVRHSMRLLSKGLGGDRFYSSIKEHEPAFFDSSVGRLVARNKFISGCWQSPKYFEGCEKLILEEFVVKKPLSKESKQFMDRIMETNSVAVHVRRGDFVRLKAFMVDKSYYDQAADLLENGMKEKPVYYIFSNDTEWARHNVLVSREVVHVDCSDQESCIEDFWLMAACKHSIVAASSFSWWSAWLSSNRNRTDNDVDSVVVAPSRWWHGEYFNYPRNMDHYPTSWRIVELP